MSTDGSTRSAAEIRVNAFRHVLFWPLAIDLECAMATDLTVSVAEEMRRLSRALIEECESSDCKWRLVRDPLLHLKPEDEQDKADAYAEFVYFHEFVQGFLYAESTPRTAETPPLRLFRRTDLGGVRVGLMAGTERLDFRLKVDRCNLYTFRTGVAMLALEVSAGPGAGVEAKPAPDGEARERPLMLADLMWLLDLFRRAYSPFWTVERLRDGGIRRDPAYLCITDLEWLDAGGAPIAFAEAGKAGRIFATQESHGDIERVIQNPGGHERAPPVFAHWRALLPRAIRLAGYSVPTRTEPVFRHVVDERMPTLTWISLTGTAGGTHAICDADWVRLCFADAPADGWPYDPRFLRDFDDTYAYDRFRHYGTRFLFAGYAMTAVGAGDGYDKYIQMHMRRHYFQLGLLAYFEHASLLALSARITRAVAHLDRERTDVAVKDDALRRFATRMAAIGHDFLQFEHRFHFTGVSNQVQAREMYDLWRKHLELPSIYGDLHREITTADAFLGARAERQQADATVRLSILATLGVVLSIPIGMLGMNVLFGSDFLHDMGLLSKSANPGGHLAVFFFMLFVSCLFGLTALLRLNRGGEQTREQKWLRRCLASMAGACLLLAVASAGVSIYRGDWKPGPPQGKAAGSRLK